MIDVYTGAAYSFVLLLFVGYAFYSYQSVRALSEEINV